MTELAEEIADLARKLAEYGARCGAGDTEGVLRVLLADSVISVTPHARSILRG